MLTPEQLKPHILDEDRWIRRAALDYFTGSWSPDPEIAGLALTANQRHFKLGEFPDLSSLHKLAIDVPTLERALALLEATPSRVVATHLSWFVASAPLAVLTKMGTAVEDHPRFEEESREKIRYRRSLGELSDEGLWAELLEFSGREKLRKIPHRLDVRADPLIDELAARKAPDNAGLAAMLKSPAFRGTHFEALLMKLAGVRRLKAMVPFLVSRIESDDEDDGPHPRNNSNEALVRIGDPDTVRLIQRRWRDINRKEAADVLGHIQTAESEKALIEFLGEEDDPDVQFCIAEALCELFSPHAVEPVLSILREGSSYDMDEELQEKFLPIIDFLKIKVPEAETWRKERQERLAEQKSPEEVNPEALNVHAQILGALAKIDEADLTLQEAYQELGERLGDQDEEEEEEDRK